MPHDGLPIAEAKALGLIKEPDRTMAKKIYTLTFTLEVEAEQDYLAWIEKKISKPIDITNSLIDDEDGTLIPPVFPHLDDALFCEHPQNYAYSSYCNWWEIKATIEPVEEK